MTDSIEKTAIGEALLRLSVPSDQRGHSDQWRMHLEKAYFNNSRAQVSSRDEWHARAEQPLAGEKPKIPATTGSIQANRAMPAAAATVQELTSVESLCVTNLGSRTEKIATPSLYTNTSGDMGVATKLDPVKDWQPVLHRCVPRDSVQRLNRALEHLDLPEHTAIRFESEDKGIHLHVRSKVLDYPQVMSLVSQFREACVRVGIRVLSASWNREAVWGEERPREYGQAINNTVDNESVINKIF